MIDKVTSSKITLDNGYGTKRNKLTFRGEIGFSLVPVVIYVFFCMVLFIGFKAFNMEALAVAGVISLVIFAIFGGMGGTVQGGKIDAASNPVSLVMLIPVVVMLIVSTKTRNIYEGILSACFWARSSDLQPACLPLMRFLPMTRQIMRRLVF